jgi:hypothetical protein
MGEISEELQVYCESHVRNNEEFEQQSPSESSDKELDKDTELKEPA